MHITAGTIHNYSNTHNSNRHTSDSSTGSFQKPSFISDTSDRGDDRGVGGQRRYTLFIKKKHIIGPSGSGCYKGDTTITRADYL